MGRPFPFCQFIPGERVLSVPDLESQERDKEWKSFSGILSG
ncbi:hypothetical protein LptCag_1930 [Leptospirillum ferriphilum]|uniref:Uncharacterized protein n=1 Tax=Leptospirillum ferriphilum TaxID=178606 RepID=A0A094WDB3_9BACT|nr:hypothetical protein LptCag_1930 [Leptospirillum ferriphilum]